MIVGRGASEAFGLFGIGLFSVWELIVTGRACSAQVVSINVAVIVLFSESVEFVFELPFFVRAVCCGTSWRR